MLALGSTVGYGWPRKVPQLDVRAHPLAFHVASPLACAILLTPPVSCLACPTSRRPMYYRGAHAAIVVMDVTRPKSLDTLRTWINELRSNGPDDIILAVAANKTDLPRSVSAAECAAAAEDFGAMYFETSAKEDLNVNDMFLAVANAMPDTSAVEAVDPTVDLASTSTGGRGSGGSGKSGCC